ncbi:MULTISPECIES: ParA family protein [unclassified Cellulomonas]|uniref:ParA family protein n=1 Tax=unclassified Cellulomonas TaxID=2620175 RepID=UPI001C4EFF46|nr:MULTISPECIES: ParA family protein [unclassified Cellulomonas]MBW0254487.1 AAA family ATPase [Cellulomonas sp. PS-H5]MCG7284714.1 AAA family ATPase [Cellulomonas sp. ACRRI]
MPTITALANQKGGVGKTATTCNFAAALTDLGRRVLVLDLDAQANSTETLDAVGEYDMYDVLRSEETGVIGDAIVETAWPGVSAVPGSKRLSLFEQESLMTPEHRLKNAMWQASGLEEFDDILIDSPPSLGRLTLNGLIVADRVVILTELEPYSIRGVGEFIETLSAVRRNPQLNPALRLAGIIVNKAKLNTIEHQEGLKELKAAFGTDVVRSPYLRASTVVPTSAGAHKPVSKMRGPVAAAIAEDYARHAKWLVEEVA